MTKIMIQKLKDCYEKQILEGGNPCVQEDVKGSLAALYKRGLVDTKMIEVKGKRILAIVLTEAGEKYLTSLDS